MTITNGTNDTGALERWLHAGAPAAEHDRPSALPTSSADSASADPARDAPAPDEHLTRMATDLERARGEAALQRDPAWLDRLSPGERRRERRAARRIRAGQRRQLYTTARSAQAREMARVRAENRIATREVGDQIWHRKAVSRRQRLLDPTSRLASLQRVHAMASAGLIAVALAGIAWTSAGVKEALVGPNGTWLGYVVEPIFSFPLIIIMAVTAVAAQLGRNFPTPERRRQVYAIEAGLLLASIALNTFPILPVVGTWQNATVLLAHLAPPVLILIAVLLQPLVTGFLAEILVEVGADVTDASTTRLTEETVTLARLAGRIRIAVAYGKLDVQPTTGVPSITAIGKYLAREKAVAQQVHALLREWDESGPKGDSPVRISAIDEAS